MKEKGINCATSSDEWSKGKNVLMSTRKTLRLETDISNYIWNQKWQQRRLHCYLQSYRRKNVEQLVSVPSTYEATCTTYKQMKWDRPEKLAGSFNLDFVHENRISTTRHMNTVALKYIPYLNFHFTVINRRVKNTNEVEL